MRDMNLNKIKLLLQELAFSHGMTDDDLNAYNETSDDFEWHINWKDDQGNSFDERMCRLDAAINLYDSAMAKGDRLTAKAGLIRAGIELQTLANFFDGMAHDIKKLMAVLVSIGLNFQMMIGKFRLNMISGNDFLKGV